MKRIMEVRFEQTHITKEEIEQFAQACQNEGIGAAFEVYSDRHLVLCLEEESKEARIDLRRASPFAEFNIEGEYIFQGEKSVSLIRSFISTTKGKISAKVYANSEDDSEMYWPTETILVPAPVSIQDAISAFRSRAAEDRAALLRLEIDYELACLFEAMSERDEKKASLSKEILQTLAKEAMALEL